MKKQFLGRGGKMDSQKWEQQQAKLEAPMAGPLI
jgi:hypothetical protein